MISDHCARAADPATLDLSASERLRVWQTAANALEGYLSQVETLPVNPPIERERLRERLSSWAAAAPHGPDAALSFVLDEMTRGQLHTAHPAYYGVFNPRPAALGVVGDALASAFNTQLASYTSAAFAIEAEQYLLGEFGRRFGFPPSHIEGVFTGGGTEANHTALLCALARRYPEVMDRGVRALPRAPVLYLSSEGHHSFSKAARMCGLGEQAVRFVPVDATYRMDVGALRQRIADDRRDGLDPLLVVATVGSTAGGIVDPLEAIADVAQTEDLWLHADAAWGGAAVLLPEMAALFAGSGRADSFTLDAHKWLSVPMTCGMFVTRHDGILEATFRVGGTSYMPKETQRSERFQPYAQSMGWSRRFLGLKLFLPLMAAGWDGYAAVLRHQVAMGDLMRQTLQVRDWQILNPTPLPVVCFTGSDEVPDVEDFCDRVARSGRTWITPARLGGRAVMRAGVSNYATQARHIVELADVLDAVRADMRGGQI